MSSIIHDRNKNKNDVKTITISYKMIALIVIIIVNIAAVIIINPSYQKQYYVYVHSYNDYSSEPTVKDNIILHNQNSKYVYDYQNNKHDVSNINKIAIGCVFRIKNYNIKNVCNYGSKNKKYRIYYDLNNDKAINIPVFLEKFIHYNENEYEYYTTGKTHIPSPCWNYYC